MFDGADGAIKYARAQEDRVALQKEKSIPPKEIILKEARLKKVQNNVKTNTKNTITWKEAQEAQAGSDGGLDTLILPEMSPAELT